MFDYLPEILAVTVAALTGAVGVLTVVAPLTDTEKDDQALSFLQKAVLPLLRKLK